MHFIGAPIADRPQLLSSLVNSGFSLKIYGSKDWLDYPDLSTFYHGYISSSDYDKTLESSLFVLCPLKDNFDGSLHMNTKIWDALRVNRIPIVEFYDPLLDDYGFIEDQSILFFRSPSDLVDCALKVKSNPLHTENVLHNMTQRVRNEFNYDFLFSKYFDFLVGLLSSSSLIDSNHLSSIDNLHSFFSSSAFDYDYIYTDYISSGFRCTQHFPFVRFSTIVSKVSRPSFLYILYLLIFKKGFHVRSLYFSYSNHSFTTYFNFFIYSSLLFMRRFYAMTLLRLLRYYGFK